MRKIHRNQPDTEKENNEPAEIYSYGYTVDARDGDCASGKGEDVHWGKAKLRKLLRPDRSRDAVQCAQLDVTTEALRIIETSRER